MQVDNIIVGQGLAGSMLAWSLIRCRQTVCVVDNEYASSASRVAAGIINPVTGPRIAPSWRLEELLSAARHHYGVLTRDLGETFLTSREIVRLFRSAEERQLWIQKRSGSGTSRFLGSMRPPGWRPGVIHDPYGSFSPGGSARLAVNRVLDRIRGFLSERDAYRVAEFDYDHLEITAAQVIWRGIEAQRIIFCEGYRGQDNPWFRWVPFKSSKGEILTLESSDERLPGQIVNRGKWLAPLGGGRFQAGATFAWESLEEGPTPQGREEILQGLKTFVSSSFKVRAHLAGVRPSVTDRRPIMGFHPEHARLALFNGFGSKGALMVPHFADHFARFINREGDLDPSVCLTRFWT